MKRFFLIFLMCTVPLLYSCSNIEEQIEPTIKARVEVGIEEGVKTRVADFTNVPTYTPYPTLTPYHTFTPLPSLTPEVIVVTPTLTKTPTNPPQSEFLNIIIQMLELQDDIEEISVVKGENGILVIEYFTKWASRDRQPIVTYRLIQDLSYIMIDNNKSEADYAWFCGDGNASFGIDITSYSTDGDYRYKSFTNYLTLEKVNNKSISYDEWVLASGAGFK